MMAIARRFEKFFNVWEHNKRYCKSIIEKLINGEFEIKDIDIDLDIDESEKSSFAAFLLALNFFELKRPDKALFFLQEVKEQEAVIRLISYSEHIEIFALLILLRSEELLNSFIKEIEEIPEEKVFKYLCEIYSIFPYLNVSEKQAFAIIQYLAKAHQDLIFGETVKSVEFWSEKHPNQVPYILGELIANFGSAITEYIEPAIIGLAKVDFEMARSQAEELLKNSKTQYIYLWIRYRLAKSINSGFDSVLNLAVEFCSRDEENDVAMAISVLINLLEEMPKNNRVIIQELNKILKRDKRPQLLYGLARQLNYSHNKTIVANFLPYLLEVKEEYKGIIEYLDWVLTKLIKNDIKRVINFLMEWIIYHNRHEEGLHTIFDSCLRELVKHDEFLIAISEWFVSTDENLATEAVNIFAEFNIKSFHPTVIKNWSEKKIATCIFRLHRLLKLSGQNCANLTYSLLLHGDAAKLKIYLIDDLKYFAKNYSGYTHEILAGKKADLPAETRLILESVLDYLNHYHSTREVVFKYKELYSNPELVSLVNKINAKKMSEQMARICDDDKFPLLKLAAKVSLARGKQWFHQAGDKFCEPANLSAMSQSYECPRMELIDPEMSVIRHLTWFKYRGAEE